MGAARRSWQRCRLKLFPKSNPARPPKAPRKQRQFIPFSMPTRFAAERLVGPLRLRVCFERFAEREDSDETHRMAGFGDASCGGGNIGARAGKLGANSESGEHYGEIAIDALQQEHGGGRGVHARGEI